MAFKGFILNNPNTVAADIVKQSKKIQDAINERAEKNHTHREFQVLKLLNNFDLHETWVKNNFLSLDETDQSVSSSKPLVDNLNADLLDGLHAGNLSGRIPINNGTLNVNLNADMVDGLHADTAATASTVAARDANADLAARGLTLSMADGTAPMTVGSTTKVDNLNVEFVGGYDADMLTTAHLLRQGIINGGCGVYQRGILTLTTALQYGQVDRFLGAVENVTAGTMQQSGTRPLSNSKMAILFVNVSTSAAGLLQAVYRMEAKDAVCYRDLSASFSVLFLHNGGSGVTATVRFYTPSTTADDFSSVTEIESTGASAQTVATGTVTTISRENVALGNCSKGLQINIEISGGPYSAAHFSFAEFQLNAGPHVLPFQPRPYAEELALCQRYYQRRQGSAYLCFGQGQAVSTTDARVSIPLPVEMRAVPTLYSGGTLSLIKADGNPQTLAAGTNPTLNGSGSNRQFVLLEVVAGAAVLAAGNATWLRAQNDTSAYIALDAEL